MSELDKELSRAAPDDATLDRVWRGVQARSAKPRRRVVPWLVIAAAALVLSVVAARPSLPRETPARSLVLGDGAVVVLEGDTRVSEVGPRALSLAHGAARFTLQGGGWVLTTRHLRVEIASAELRAEVGDMQDSVTVTRGEVKLQAPGAGVVVLRAGQTFATSGASWEALARSGDFAGAWALLGEAGVRAVQPHSTLEQQLLLADVAQAGGAEPLSVSVLTGVANASSGGSERGLAAFTLGQRLSRMGRGAEARAAFEKSLTLELPPELADEARRMLQTVP